MNVYVVVEGPTEKHVYTRWIPLANPSLKYVEHPSLAQSDNFCIVSSMGYPVYFQVIDDAIQDVSASLVFDRLVVLVDSHDQTLGEKNAEIDKFLATKRCTVQVLIVIQHFCFEAWALGNRRLIRPSPTTQVLRTYKRIYDVRANDPELLPPYPPKSWNRSQFAASYLRAAFNEKHRNLTYSKGQPEFVAHPKYFEQLKLRRRDTGHIPSFASFLKAFV